MQTCPVVRLEKQHSPHTIICGASMIALRGAEDGMKPYRKYDGKTWQEWRCPEKVCKNTIYIEVIE